MNSGARYQIIVLKVYPDKDLKVKELETVRQYLCSNYKVLTFCYGSSKNSVVKTIEKMFEKKLLFSPKNTIFETVSVFVNNKACTYGDIIDYCSSQQSKKFNETVSKGLKRLVGG